MAAQHDTPNVFFGFPPEILSALDRQIQYIDRIVERELEQNTVCQECGWSMSKHTYGCGGLPVCPWPICAHESSERHPGSCDGGVQCQKRATVHNLRTGQEFCLEHFDGIIK